MLIAMSRLQMFIVMQIAMRNDKIQFLFSNEPYTKEFSNVTRKIRPRAMIGDAQECSMQEE